MKQKTKCAIGASILAPIVVIIIVALIGGLVVASICFLPKYITIIIFSSIGLFGIVGFTKCVWQAFYESCTAKHKDIIEREQNCKEEVNTK